MSTTTALIVPSNKTVYYVWISEVDNSVIQTKIRTRGRPPTNCEKLPRADGNFYIVVKPTPVSAGPVASLSDINALTVATPTKTLQTTVSPTGETAVEVVTEVKAPEVANIPTNEQPTEGTTDNSTPFDDVGEQALVIA